jgi:hypothetical protein
MRNGLAFTREGKLVPKPTGYEHKKLSPRYPALGVLAGSYGATNFRKYVV